MRYTAYGLGIDSSFALPELDRGARPADVTVRGGDVPDCGPSGRVAGARARFSWPGVGRFAVEGGRRIVVDGAPGVAPRTLRAFVLGPALATALRQRGLLVLHASAIAVAGEAVAFLGGPGWGKSTTAAALHARGHDVMADDVLAVCWPGGHPVVLPGIPRLKLWPDVSRALGKAPATLPRVHPGLDKRDVRVKREGAATPRPLGRIYVLGAAARGHFEALGAQEALVELLRHSYGAKTLHEVRTEAHFRDCARLAASVAVRRLTHRRSLESLAELARGLERDLACPVD